MKVNSILRNNNHIIIKQNTLIFVFLLGIIVSLVLIQGADKCFGADMVSGSFAELVKRSSPAVVQINVINKNKQAPNKGMGTGFIIDKEGYILTSNSVVTDPDDIKVTLLDKTEYKAEVICLDPKTDLALIKIDGAKDLLPLTLGDSDKVEVGDYVVTIGNPFGLINTFTAGTVNAKHRRLPGERIYEDYIQTDAFMYPGSAGGPLIHTNGSVIGINSFIFSPQGGVGFGFAMPSNIARELLPQLKKGKVVRGWIGIVIQDISLNFKEALKLKSEKGALVASLITSGPAEKAGFKQGDVIISFDGKEIEEVHDLLSIVSSTEVGKIVSVEIIRDSRKMTKEVEVEEQKD